MHVFKEKDAKTKIELPIMKFTLSETHKFLPLQYLFDVYTLWETPNIFWGNWAASLIVS